MIEFTEEDRRVLGIAATLLDMPLPELPPQISLKDQAKAYVLLTKLAERPAGDAEECECEGTGIYEEGDEWAPCSECDLGRDFAARLRTTVAERDQRLRGKLDDDRWLGGIVHAHEYGDDMPPSLADIEDARQLIEKFLDAALADSTEVGDR